MPKAIVWGAIVFALTSFVFAAVVALNDDAPVVVIPAPPALPGATTVILEGQEPTEVQAVVDAAVDSGLYDGSAPALVTNQPVVEPALPEPATTTTEEPAAVAIAPPAATPVALQPAPPKVECGPATCPPNWECCNASCGICTPKGQGCSHVVCGQSSSLASIACGPSTCENGTVCCDPACGKCISPGEKCTPGSCLNPMTFPTSENCGMATCNVGQVCCNPRCGLCTAPGESCSATC